MTARRPGAREVLLIVGCAIGLAALWLAVGALVIDGLGKSRVLPLWWVVGATIPAGTVLALMRRSARGEPAIHARILWAFAIGGPISLAIGATLNGLLIIGDDPGETIWWVGLTEEGAKLIAAALLAIGVAKSLRSGVLLGAAVGFGFAVWEDAGYFFGQYLAGASGWAEQAAFVLTRAVVGGGIHALLSAFVVGAVFAAWHRPSARRVLAAVLVFALMAFLHSGYDRLMMSPVFDDAPEGLFEVSDLVTVGLQAVLLVVLLLVLRRDRRREAMPAATGG